MTATTELSVISGALRKACLSRWTQDGIVNHVVVNLPAPIFDTILRETRHEVSFGRAPGQEDTDGISWFKFAGIKYQRIDGVYWTVNSGPGGS